MKRKKRCLGFTYAPLAGGWYRCNQPGRWPKETKHPQRHRRMYEPSLPALINEQLRKGEGKVSRAFKPRGTRPISAEVEPAPKFVPAHLRYQRQLTAAELARRAWTQGSLMTLGL